MTRADRVIGLFLFLIPLLYALQVLLWRNDFVPIPYAAVFLAMLATAWRRTGITGYALVNEPVLLDELMGFFVLMNGTWVVFELLTMGVANAARVAMYFVLPPLLYFYVSRWMSSRLVDAIPKLASFTALVVAAEMLYERYVNLFDLRTTFFQLRNFDYVATIGMGGELGQLKAVGYRLPGLMEHLHATGTFLGVGALAGLFLFLANGKVRYLVAFVITLVALLASGARTAVIATAVATMSFAYLSVRHTRTRDSGRARMFIGVAVLFGITAFFVFAYAPLAAIYQPVLDGSALQGRSFTSDIIPEAIAGWLGGIKQAPLALFFGLGPGPGSWFFQLGMSNDDFFIIDVVGRYGLIGAGVFFLMPVLYWRETAVLLGSRGYGSMEEKRATALWFCVVLLLMLTTIHSGALMRKGIFPWLFVGYGIGRRHILGAFPPLLVLPEKPVSGRAGSPGSI